MLGDVNHLNLNPKLVYIDVKTVVPHPFCLTPSVRSSYMYLPDSMIKIGSQQTKVIAVSLLSGIF